MTSSHRIPSPILESPPPLPPPDWNLLATPPSSRYQSNNQLQNWNQKLTEPLACAQRVITAHELMGEHCDAQLIIQHCILQKQNKSMKAKENKKNDDCTKLLPKGMGRHLTEAGFIQAVRDKETEKQQKLDEKEGRKVARWAKKSVKQSIEEISRLTDAAQRTSQRSLQGPRSPSTQRMVLLLGLIKAMKRECRLQTMRMEMKTNSHGVQSSRFHREMTVCAATALTLSTHVLIISKKCVDR